MKGGCGIIGPTPLSLISKADRIRETTVQMCMYASEGTLHPIILVVCVCVRCGAIDWVLVVRPVTVAVTT